MRNIDLQKVDLQKYVFFRHVMSLMCHFYLAIAPQFGGLGRTGKGCCFIMGAGRGSLFFLRGGASIPVLNFKSF